MTPTTLCPIHQALGRPWRQGAIFRVRVETFSGAFPLVSGPGVFWSPSLASLLLCQRFYLHLRDCIGAGASQFSDGWILEETSKEMVARISYNGRLWHPRPWRAGDAPVAEAPARDDDPFPTDGDPSPPGGSVLFFPSHLQPSRDFP